MIRFEEGNVHLSGEAKLGADIRTASELNRIFDEYLNTGNGVHLHLTLTRLEVLSEIFALGLPLYLRKAQKAYESLQPQDAKET